MKLDEFFLDKVHNLPRDYGLLQIAIALQNWSCSYGPLQEKNNLLALQSLFLTCCYDQKKKLLRCERLLSQTVFLLKHD